MESAKVGSIQRRAGALLTERLAETRVGALFGELAAAAAFVAPLVFFCAAFDVEPCGEAVVFFEEADFFRTEALFAACEVRATLLVEACLVTLAPCALEDLTCVAD
ncbi:MAG: hypothetical protein ACUVXB_12645 [Bryobacteraceae bacterium]